MLIYYNPNPLNKNVGDCVIRALTKALQKQWSEVYAELCVYGLYMADMPSSNAVWGAYLIDNGFNRYILPNDCPDCYTIGNFAAEHLDGIYVVATGTHTVTVENGNIYDSWHSENEVPIYYFHKN